MRSSTMIDGSRSGMFCIVEFVKGRKRMLVRDSWLCTLLNDTLCLLPPNASDSDVEVLVRSLAEPNGEWQMLEVSLVEKFESYSEAKKQLEIIKKTPQIETSRPQRKRKKLSYIEDNSTSDSDSGLRPHTDFEAVSDNERIPPLEFNPRIISVSTVRKTIHSDDRPQISRLSQSQLSTENIDITCDCQSSCHRTFLRALHNVQEQLYSMQKHSDRTNLIMQQLLESQKQTHSQLKRILQLQPVSQTDSQEEMDASSEDSTNFVQCVDRDIEAKVDRHTEQILNTGLVDGSLNSPDPIQEEKITDGSNINAEPEQSRYLVVKFLDEGLVAVVPRNWEQNGVCFWPPSHTAPERIKKMVLSCDPPEDDWQKRAVDVKYSTESYDLTRGLLKKAEETSDLATSDFSGSEKRKRRTTAENLDLSTLDNNGEEASILLPSFAPRIKIQPPTLEELSKDEVLEVLPPSLRPNSQLSTQESPTTNEHFEELLLGKLNFHIVKLKSLEEKMDGLLKKANSNYEPESSLSSEIRRAFPMKNQRMLDAVEKYISDEDNRKSVVLALKGIGGITVQNVIVNILKMTFKNELAELYSFVGAKGTKLPFKKLNFCRVILDTTRIHFPETTEDQFGNIVARWLVYSKQRMARERKISRSGAKEERIDVI